MREVKGGPGIQVATSGGVVSISATRRTSNAGGEVKFWARIASSNSIASNRWSYSVVEVEPDTAGTFKDVSGGKSVTAYNTIEANNSATGTQGDGTDPANYPSGVTLQPIGVGAVVRVLQTSDCNGATLYLFEVANNPDGSCA